MPQFAHLPLLLKPEGNGKLSKRDGDRLGFPVFPLEWKDPKTADVSSGYREAGYFPEAVINFLALLGWNSGTEQEIFSMDELIQLFSLDRVSKSGAKFDYEKGKWFNHQYLIKKSNEEVAELFQGILTEKGISGDKDKITHIVGLVKERVHFVKELWEETSFFFVAPTSYDEKAVQKRWKEETPTQLKALTDLLLDINDFSSAEKLEETVKAWIEEKGYNIGAVMNPLRLSLVGELKGPHVFDIVKTLGKEESIGRILKAIEVLG